MAINIYTDFKAMSWEKLTFLKIMVECAPRGTIKNRWVLRQRIKFERRRRRRNGLIPDLDINDRSPEA